MISRGSIETGSTQSFKKGTPGEDHDSDGIFNINQPRTGCLGGGNALLTRRTIRTTTRYSDTSTRAIGQITGRIKILMLVPLRLAFSLPSTKPHGLFASLRDADSTRCRASRLFRPVENCFSKLAAVFVGVCTAPAHACLLGNDVAGMFSFAPVRRLFWVPNTSLCRKRPPRDHRPPMLSTLSDKASLPQIVEKGAFLFFHACIWLQYLS
ncbi:hypothetical protein NA57DRAFT_55450 [Rhizodiscina lignyota]|uniref:Uncharacterized protein n=1 Tax=Rhizodiscina lignyota TaxID=1504668 RepID=A0A9P4IDB1_9PEZI|nr:hypothetical protein NA57DRAFT_55450 [Rhizodiscina lignyota]